MLPKSIGLQIICLSAYALSACNATEPVHPRVLNNQFGEVRLIGRVSDGEHRIDKNLAVTVKLQNTGRTPVVVPDAWATSISLFAEDSVGKGLVANPIVETMLPPPFPGTECERMLRLESGQAVEAVKQVDVYTLGIETPGVYNVLVGYNPNGKEFICAGAPVYTGLPAISVKVNISK